MTSGNSNTTPGCLIEKCLSKFKHVDECALLDGCGARWMLRRAWAAADVVVFSEADAHRTNRFVDQMADRGWLTKVASRGPSAAVITQLGMEAVNGIR